MSVKNIIRQHSTMAGKVRWLVQLKNGATSIMTTSELLADSRAR